MAPQSEQPDLAIAWRALESVEQSTGWRTIPVASDGDLRILAARRFPGKEEALLVGFRSVTVPPVQHLPQGKGFAVERVDPGIGGIWIALSRQGTASLTLFSLMAQDLIAVLATSSSGHEDALLFAFLARVRAWQDFMQKGTDGVLGQEEEVGLVGELSLLLALLRVHVEPTLTIESWQGPLDGVHDFVLGTGAIEVKTTLAASAFPAVIASLDQLDDSARRPLYIAAFRSSLSAAGKTLPNFVTDVRHELTAWPTALVAADRFPGRSIISLFETVLSGQSQTCPHYARVSEAHARHRCSADQKSDL
jgi:hypothetical protein